MWLIQFAIFGLVAGAIARLLHPGRDPMNWVWTTVLGIAGAVLGGWVANAMGMDVSSGLPSWIAAVVSSIVLLALYHAATARTAALGRPRSTTNEDYKQAVFDDPRAVPTTDASRRLHASLLPAPRKRATMSGPRSRSHSRSGLLAISPGPSRVS
jgi:uncharacterized membrane protein YeaQ/YmgE (transglycosylase-associated protein family)